MSWGDGVEEAMKKVAQRSDDGWVVCLVRSVRCHLSMPLMLMKRRKFLLLALALYLF